MIFTKGMKARLVTFEEYQKNDPDTYNHNSGMIPFFGTIVTITNVLNVQCTVENSRGYYHKDWFIPIKKKISLKNIQEL